MSNTDIVQAWIKAYPTGNSTPATSGRRVRRWTSSWPSAARFTGTVRAPFLGLDEVPPTGKAGKNPDERVTATIGGGKIARFDVERVPGAGVPRILSRVGVDLPAPA